VIAPGPLSSASGNPAAPTHANRETARLVVPLFRPYRVQVAAVVGLIVVTSTIGIINPLLIQAVFNKALFIPGGPNLRVLVILVVIPIINGAIGILQTYQPTRVGQQVMRDLRDRLYAHLQTLPLACCWRMARPSPQGPSSRSPRCRPACTSRSGSCCRSR
jgi:ATP-binding cassette, subfamily B, bacterial